MNNNLRIGVALSSGGGRGVFAHTGFLQALKQLHIKVSAIAGCSAGALVGGIYASGTDLQKWSDVIASVKPDDYWTPDTGFKLLWKLAIQKGRGYTGISDNQTAIEFIRRNLKVNTFEECVIPFYCLAFNLSTPSKTIFDSGELAPRIMASAAIPMLYKPVKIDGQWLSDGAAIELAPTDAVCCKQNLDVLIVHHTAITHKNNDGLKQALMKRWTMLELLYMQLYKERPWYLSDEPFSEHVCPCGCGARIVVLEPDLPDMSWPFSSEGVKIQKSAKKQTLEMLRPKLKTWIELSDKSRLELEREGRCS